MTPQNKRRIAYSLAAALVIVAWRPLRGAVESDALFFALALGLILVLGAVAGRLSR